MVLPVIILHTVVALHYVTVTDSEREEMQRLSVMCNEVFLMCL